ncbi:hypothetical protein [Streptomyces sp. NPDC089799]|uniref:hypothetical protein n=1 Tax=Streptomyces sp. NPDC089799 TaxID=3155066 RepID=UPI0034150077
MNMRKTLAIGAAVIALGSTAACGGGDGDDSGLPKAKNVASIQAFIKEHGECRDLTDGPAYDKSDSGSGDGTAWGEEEAPDPSWAIKERAVCQDASNHPIALLSVPDMKKFQTAAREHKEKFLVGHDFAVVPVGDDAGEQLLRAGLKILSCEKDFEIPSGFENKPGLVEGCFLTNYIPPSS